MFGLGYFVHFCIFTLPNALYLFCSYPLIRPLKLLHLDGTISLETRVCCDLEFVCVFMFVF